MAAGTRLLRAAVLLLGLCRWMPAAQAFSRQLIVKLYPGPEAPPGDLLHVRAVGEEDTLHFLFCSVGAPTLLLIHSGSPVSTVSVNWTQFVSQNASGSLRVEPEGSVLSSTGLVFSRLLEFDDVNDTAAASPSDLYPPYDLREVSWSRLHLSGPAARLCGAVANGSICLQLEVFGSEGRSQMWPRLLHSANSSQVEVILDGLRPRAERSRFLLELQAVGGAPLSLVEVRRSIDDEYTPSIFQVTQWLTSDPSGAPGFVQWKPVSYRRAPPSLEVAAPCNHSSPRLLAGEEAAPSALVRAFFSDPETFGLNVSYGMAGDPFFNATAFLSWTLLMGVGTPPLDSFSPLVASIMAVGLGAPLVLLLLGGAFICSRRRDAASGYEPIN